VNAPDVLNIPALVIPYVELRPFHIGPIVVQSFGALVGFGIVVAAVLAGRRARKVGLDSRVVTQLVRLSAFFGITGSHVVHLVVYHPEELVRDPWSLLKFWSGMSSFGGFIAAAIAVGIYLRRKRIRFLPYADVLMFGFWPGWAISRIGCATAHDHPGRLSDFFLAVNYPGGARHDLGLYEVLLSAFWIPLVYWLGRKNDLNDPPPGSILSAMIIAYSVPRFFLDFLRATDLPHSDVRFFGLTPAQYAALALTGVSVWFFVRQRSRSDAS
jgi:phosphatidylglycerol:prolipoprotein diacylglycerol transferase